MYILMNKDNIIGYFDLVDTPKEQFKLLTYRKDKLPIGFTDINIWIKRRQAFRYNENIRKLMETCGCASPVNFIKITHCASLNDTFWIKEESENITFKNISLYRNNFNEVISKSAFEGTNEIGVLDKNKLIPDFTTDGSFKKCWEKENDGIYLYKRGSEGARNAGLEPFGEVMASELAQILCKSATAYELSQLYGIQASKCKLFTSEDVGYIQMSKFEKMSNVDDLLSFFYKIGAEDEFRRMIVLDSITFNVDRHFGNFGVLINNDTHQILGMAPVFDLNLSLLPYLEQEDFINQNKISDYRPRIGNDFTSIGQNLLTPGIRNDLINLTGFNFSFNGNDKFPKWRIKCLEEIIGKQIDSILSKEKFYTVDIGSNDSDRSKIEQTNAEAEKINKTSGHKNNPLLERLCGEIEKLKIGDVYLGINEQEKFTITIIEKKQKNIAYEIEDDLSIKILDNDDEIPYSLFLLNYDNLLAHYIEIAKVVDQISEPERITKKDENKEISLE